MKKLFLLVAIITFGFLNSYSQLINRTDTFQINGTLLPVYCGEYTILPILQVQEFKLHGRFINTGLDPISNAKIFFTVIDSFGVIHSDSSLVSGTVNAGDTSVDLNPIGNPFILTSLGQYTIEQKLYLAGDADTTDNFYSTSILIDDSSYARDYTAININDYAGTVGFQGATITFGQKFRAHLPSLFTSASFYLNHPTLNDHVNVSVYSLNPNGEPDQFLGSSSSYIISSDDTGGAFLTLPFLSWITVANSDEYFVAINQLDTNDLTLGISNGIYTPFSGYYNLNGAGWLPNENAALNVALMLRVNNPSNTLLGIKNLPEVKSDITIYPNPSNGLFYICSNRNEKKDLTIRIFNSLGQEVKRVFYYSFISEQLNLIELPSGIYSVKIQSDSGEESKKIVLSK